MMMRVYQKDRIWVQVFEVFSSWVVVVVVVVVNYFELGHDHVSMESVYLSYSSQQQRKL